MNSYRRMLALPRARALMILAFLARIPLSAASMTLTLHVALGLGRGYGAAGTVGAAATVGLAVGAPFMGRITDRYGLRPMVVLTTLGEVLFWSVARLLPYPTLLVAAFAGGLIALPVMPIGRQAIAALIVDDDLRRAGYSLDSVSIDLAYVVGPTLSVLIATQVSTRASLLAMAIGVAAVGVAIYVFNPPIKSEAELAEAGERPPRRQWLTPAMLAVFAIGSGAVFILSGTEVAVVAALRAHDQITWTGVVYGLWSAGSIAGGLVYGALRNGVPQVRLMALLGVFTMPIGLAAGQWWALALAIAPAAALCAPTIAATGEQVGRLAPAVVRGEATGLQSSAFTIGSAVGAPLVGFAVDHFGPPYGFGVAGLGGVLIAVAAAAVMRRQRSVKLQPA